MSNTEENISDISSKSNLIVNYLPQPMTDGELYSMFVTCGPLLQARIIRDRETGYSYGYGFVHYANDEDAEKAIETLSGISIQNKVIKVSYARPNSKLIKDTNLYVSNLGSSISEESVERMFSAFGTIITLNLLRDPATKTPKGVAFVRYSKQSEAQDAISALNGTSVNNSDKLLQVKVAEEHGKQNGRYAYCQVPHHQASQMMFFNRGRGRGRGGRGGNNRYNPIHRGGQSSAGYMY